MRSGRTIKIGGASFDLLKPCVEFFDGPCVGGGKRADRSGLADCGDEVDAGYAKHRRDNQG